MSGQILNSQAELREEILKPIRKGFDWKYFACDMGSGVSTVANSLTRASRSGDGPRIVRVVALSPKAWEVLQNLELVSKTTKRESSLSRSAWNSLAELSNDGKRAVTVLVEAVERMKNTEVAILMDAIESATLDLELSVQLCLFVKEIEHHEATKSERSGKTCYELKFDFPKPSQLLKDREKRNPLKAFKFNKQGLEKLTRAEADLAAERMAVAS